MSVGSFLLGALFVGGFAWLAGFASGLAHADRECVDRPCEVEERCSSTFAGVLCELPVNHRGVHCGHDGREPRYWPRRFYV